MLHEATWCLGAASTQWTSQPSQECLEGYESRVPQPNSSSNAHHHANFKFYTFYGYEDGYTHAESVLKDFIASLLVHPVTIWACHYISYGLSATLFLLNWRIVCHSSILFCLCLWLQVDLLLGIILHGLSFKFERSESSSLIIEFGKLGVDYYVQCSWDVAKYTDLTEINK